MYGAEAIVPPAALGLQARGGIQWGGLGQDTDYTVWVEAPAHLRGHGLKRAGDPLKPEYLKTAR
jgi:hypothetical protein